MTQEVRIGVLAVLVIAVAMIVSYVFHQGGWRKSEGVKWFVVLPSSQGVSKGTPVRYVGVNVGKVVDVSLSDNHAVVTVCTESETSIPKNADIKVDKDGILGTCFLSVTGGYGERVISGDTVEGKEDQRWEKMTQKANKLVKTLEETKRNISLP